MEESRESTVKKPKPNNSVTETSIRMSEDRKWILFVKTETTFYRYNYISAILNSKPKDSATDKSPASGMEF